MNHEIPTVQIWLLPSTRMAAMQLPMSNVDVDRMRIRRWPGSVIDSRFNLSTGRSICGTHFVAWILECMNLIPWKFYPKGPHLYICFSYVSHFPILCPVS